MLNHIYKVGAIVEHDDTGMVGEIVHRGPNYIIMKDGLGGEHKAWLQHVTEVANQPLDQSTILLITVVEMSGKLGLIHIGRRCRI